MSAERTAFPEREELQSYLDLLDGLRPFEQSGAADIRVFSDAWEVTVRLASQAARRYVEVAKLRLGDRRADTTVDSPALSDTLRNRTFLP